MNPDELKVTLERSKRRLRYKELLDRGAELMLVADCTNPVETFDDVREIVAKSNALLEEGRIRDRAENATEMLMDVQVIKMSHELVQVAADQAGNSDFADEHLTGPILGSFDTDQGIQNWEKITREAASLFHMTKHQQSLYGTFKPEPVTVEKVCRERAKRQRVDFGEEKKPETVRKLQKQEKSAQKLNDIFNRIIDLVAQRNGVPIPYYQLILDPSDFMGTVDNAFQLSFLIRDGRVVLLSDENHEPIVREANGQELEKAKRQSETTQAIFGLNPRKWRELVARYGVGPALLSREKFTDTSQSQQDGADDSALL